MPNSFLLKRHGQINLLHASLTQLDLINVLEVQEAAASHNAARNHLAERLEAGYPAEELFSRLPRRRRCYLRTTDEVKQGRTPPRHGQCRNSRRPDRSPRRNGRQRPHVISQADLRLYLDQVPLVRGANAFRAWIVARLAAGANVERGMSSATFTERDQRQWTLEGFDAVLSAAGAAELWRRMPRTQYRRLRIRDKSGRLLDWHEQLNAAATFPMNVMEAK